ncbi:MAG: EamA family transporter [Acidimicrobiales bacterium]
MRRVQHPPALPLVGAGAVSVQFGAALATKLFDRVGPVGAVTLRLVIAAIILAALAFLLRPRLTPQRIPPADLRVAVAFGLVLAAMNLSFYEAIDRIPLGVAVTLEFSGPVAVALAGSRRWTDAVWALLAATGVALLATGTGSGLDPAGVGLALLSGACWAGYILLNKQTGQRFTARHGLGIAMVVGALAILPAGIVVGGGRLFAPAVLGLGAVVAVLSSVVPYTLELLALRGVTPRAFGVMLSLDPAIASAAGFAVLGQHLSGREWAALGLVMAANLGNSLSGRSSVVATSP